MPIIKCHNCEKEFERKAYLIARYKNNYCNRSCQAKAMNPIKYTDEVLKFIQENYLTLGLKIIAEKTGCTIQGLKKQVSVWRKNGVAIPRLKRGRKKSKSIKVKTQKIKMQKPPKPKKENVFHQSTQKAPKPAEKRLPNRKVDMSQYKYVKVDSKTFVLRKIENNDCKHIA